jgi:hypothetical protein
MQQPILLSPDSGKSLPTFSCSYHKTSQYCAESTVWPARTNSSLTIQLMSKKVLTLKRPCTANAFFPEHLCNHCQGLRCSFSEICTKIDAQVPLYLSPNIARSNIRFQIKERKISTFTQLREILRLRVYQSTM